MKIAVRNPQQLNQLESDAPRPQSSLRRYLVDRQRRMGREGSEKGTRITQAMQDFAKRIDSTRPITVAISGGWGNGSSISIDVMGFNYFTHGDSDKYHAKFPDKPSVGTEDGSTVTTRGIYVEDRDHQHLTAHDKTT
jgi:beta-galactosidase